METAIVTALGKTLLASALSDLYTFMKESNYKEQLEQVMQELDLAAEIQIVQAIINDIKTDSETQAIKVSADQVKDTIQQIHNELAAIHQELEYHRTRYFYQWRSPQYERNLRHLRKYKDALRKRRELLIQVLTLAEHKHTDTETKLGEQRLSEQKLAKHKHERRRNAILASPNPINPALRVNIIDLEKGIIPTPKWRSC